MNGYRIAYVILERTIRTFVVKGILSLERFDQLEKTDHNAEYLAVVERSILLVLMIQT